MKGHLNLVATSTFVSLLILSGCAHVPAGKDQSPEQLLSFACTPGEKTQSIKGSVWLKAKSKEASGQFPANVQAEGTHHLKLEVTNLLGASEAVITVEGGKYTIEIPSRKRGPKKEEGSNSWGGIPLQWATDLFIGRIPCPSATSLNSAHLSVTDQGALVIETTSSLGRDAEKYVFQFRKWEGNPWPETLHWESKGSITAAVDFKFDDPEDGTHSPKKWEATSSQGEVKVRWKDREIAR